MKTYECKIKDESSFSFLREINASFGSWTRTLYVHLYGNPTHDKNELKRNFLKQKGVSSTHYNSLKNYVDGIFKSRKELGIIHAGELRSRLTHTDATIKKLEKTVKEHKESISRIKHYQLQLNVHKFRLSQGMKSKKPRKLTRVKDTLSIREQHRLIVIAKHKCHQKKRRLNILEDKYLAITEKIEGNHWPICFGSKKLQSKQNFLKENLYDGLADWKEDWQFSRSSQSYWVGDTKEKGRNRTAKLDLDNGTIRLTVPESLRAEFGSFFKVEGLQFDSRAEIQIRNALDLENLDRKAALSYRILEREKVVKNKEGSSRKRRNFYLQVVLEEESPPLTTLRGVGAVGVDLNADHLAIGEIDRFGNPIQAFKLSIDYEGKTSGQITAMFGDHIRDIVAYCKLKNKPISIEKLDFTKKKAALRETQGRRMAHMLSSFAYQKFMSMMASKCASEGVKLIVVNPAFSSLLGAYNYFGLAHLYSSHQMAGFILARRAMGFKDSLKCTYNEKNHTTLLRTVSIVPEKAPPTLDAWIKNGGNRHRWSLLRRYFKTFSHFVKYLGSKHTGDPPCCSRGQRRNFQSSPSELLLSLA